MTTTKGLLKKVWIAGWWITLVGVGWILATCSENKKDNTLVDRVDTLTRRNSDQITDAASTSILDSTSNNESASVIIWGGEETRKFYENRIKNLKASGTLTSSYQPYTREQVIRRVSSYVQRIYNVKGTVPENPKLHKEPLVMFIPRSAIEKLLLDLGNAPENELDNQGFVAFLVVDQETVPGKPSEDTGIIKNQTFVLAPYKKIRRLDGKYVYRNVANNTQVAYGLERWRTGTKLSDMFGGHTRPNPSDIRPIVESRHFNGDVIEVMDN